MPSSSAGWAPSSCRPPSSPPRTTSRYASFTGSFCPRGTTVSEWIRHRRLERCRRDLLDPRLAELPVHAVGARWGFRCAADFSRAFKTAYGTPPGDYRRRNRPGPTKRRD
ncbi:helix-turn-helix domain-containing protein [Streptomyces canus]|uniref:helix-turn-helix domain-containing protein n=1 Tax=Streptomyces canus TaxID=58343 RepID=UPI002DD7E5D6|nr:helix-turn-helix domain-containing protein [Streptomyces canus]WSD92019.1 helix-turn-helix domain-containing protein [Streptomyces canus]